MVTGRHHPCSERRGTHFDSGRDVSSPGALERAGIHTGSNLISDGAVRRRNNGRKSQSPNRSRSRKLAVRTQARRKKRIPTAFCSAWSIRNADTWNLPICWSERESRCPARTSHNETRKSAWEQDNNPGRDLKLKLPSRARPQCQNLHWILDRLCLYSLSDFAPARRKAASRLTKAKKAFQEWRQWH